MRDKAVVVSVGAMFAISGAIWWMINSIIPAAVMGVYGLGLLFGALCIDCSSKESKHKPQNVYVTQPSATLEQGTIKAAGKALEIADLFRWRGAVASPSAIRYDAKNQVILLDKRWVAWAIRCMNPMQEDRDIMLVDNIHAQPTIDRTKDIANG